MLQHAIVALGAGTLCAAASAVIGAGTIELSPAPEPRPTYLALAGDLVDLAAKNHGPGCFEPMLDELRRHPHWSIRIDHLEWGDVVSDEPDPRHATLVIDGETATWRDGSLPQTLTLTGAERRDVLAAFALDCRIDEALPVNGYTGDYIGVALGDDGPTVTQFPTNSPIAARLLELFDAVRARYLATRVEDLSGFSIELTGTRRDHDDQGRMIRRPHRIEYLDPGVAGDDLEDRVRLLDWAMAKPVSLPPGKLIVRGTLRAHGSSRPIALDLRNLGLEWSAHRTFRELVSWEASEHPLDADDTGAGD